MTLLQSALLLAACAAGADNAPAKSKALKIDHCIVSLIDEAQVAAKKPGLISKLAVSEGSPVQLGDVLAQIDDAEVRIAKTIAEREYAAAAKEAANDINVRYSVAAAGVAKAEVESALDVNARIPGTVAAAEVRRLRLAQHRADLGIEQAQQQFQVAKITATVRQAHVDAAALEIASRQIPSPVDGIVVRLHRHAGEWVNAGDPICHVVRLDRLRVTGFVNVADYDQEQVQGRSAKVLVKLASGRVETFTGKIDFASPLVQAGGEYRVWADIENRQRDGFWALRPGLIAEMEIALSPSATTTMTSAADAMISTASRPLRLRMRPDLVVREHRYLGRSYWVVKEPIALKYFRFHEEEFAILQMLDGGASLGDIKAKFEAQFLPRKIELQDVHQFIAQLHRSGLVTSTAPGQGRSLYERAGEVKRRELRQKLSSVLALRFKGVDPEWFLDRTYPYVRWLFHPLAVALWIVLAVAALSLVAVKFDDFQSRLPTFHQFFGPHNWLLLACVLAVTKIIHEFGHGYSCKHFGGECHEIGVMLLVFTPCLYCNVSDSWLLPSKWRRAAIGAAGMYIEVLMASLATFVWWFTEPGLVNHIALQVMFICSVSTVLFNGNPLMRYDGYYILSDLVEIPNLQQKARQVLQRLAATWCLGLELPENPFLPQRNQALFALFTIASTIYRWVVVFSIMFFLSQLFEPYGLKVLGHLMILASLIGIVVVPLVQLVKFLAAPGRMEQVKRKNVLATAGVVGAALAFVAFVPLPHRVRTSAELTTSGFETVYVQVPGQIRDVQTEPGERVALGDPLVTLANYDVDLSVAELRGRRDEQRAMLDAMRAARETSATAGGGIAAVEESLAAAQEQLDEKMQDLRKLDVTAPAAGIVIEPAAQSAARRDERQLPAWSGSPLDDRNVGAWLDEGAVLCYVGDPQRMEAQLVIDQGDIEFVRVGQTVWLKLDASAGRTFRGEIAEIARIELQQVSPGLSTQSGGTLATRSDASGTQTPLSTSYVARVHMTNDDGLLRPGMRGRAKISTPWQTLGQRGWRWAHRTFRFEL